MSFSLWSLFFFLVPLCVKSVPKCGIVYQDIHRDKYFFTGGKSVGCDREFHVSYESCRLLLLHSNCTALQYTPKTCVLLDRRRNDFKVNQMTNLQKQSTAGVISALKLVPDLDECKGNVNISFHYPHQRLQRCIQNNKYFKINKSKRRRTKAIQTQTMEEFLKLPLLNIVISVTQSWINKNKQEMDFAISHWKCYAKLHKYKFTLNVLNSAGPNEFFVERHESIAETYLPQSQWVLHIDADSIVLNMGRSLNEFLAPILPLDSQINSTSNSTSSSLRSKYSIILQMRENGEVTSGIYLVRNDPRSYCFLYNWRSFHPTWTKPSRWVPKRRILPTPNNCNGALVASILFLVTDVEGVNCLQNYQYDMRKRPYPYPEQACLNRYRAKAYELTQHNMSSYLESFGVRMLWKSEGLWRSQEKDNPDYQKTRQWELFCRCYPTSDLIGHGNKDIARDLLEPHHTTQCDINLLGNNDTTSTTSSSYTTTPVVVKPLNYSNLNRSRNGRCIWYNEKEEKAILRKYCLWRSPACFSPFQPNDSTPFEIRKTIKNICISPSRKHLKQDRLINPSCYEYRDLIRVDIEKGLYNLSLAELS